MAVFELLASNASSGDSTGTTQASVPSQGENQSNIVTVALRVLVICTVEHSGPVVSVIQLEPSLKIFPHLRPLFQIGLYFGTGYPTTGARPHFHFVYEALYEYSKKFRLKTSDTDEFAVFAEIDIVEWGTSC